MEVDNQKKKNIERKEKVKQTGLLAVMGAVGPSRSDIRSVGRHHARAHYSPVAGRTTSDVPQKTASEYPSSRVGERPSPGPRAQTAIADSAGAAAAAVAVVAVPAASSSYRAARATQGVQAMGTTSASAQPPDENVVTAVSHCESGVRSESSSVEAARAL